MNGKLAIIGAIEGTVNQQLEKDYLFFVSSLRKNGGDFRDVDVHLVQPTKHDISSIVYNQLINHGVYYHKIDPEYNQSSRDYNYTNKPIACEWLHDNISSDYDYFLWVDGDVLILSQPTIPSIDKNQIMFLYNNQFYDTQSNEYIRYNSTDFEEDRVAYMDLMLKAGEDETYYTATNSWIIYAHASSMFWKRWNIKTKKYINNIQRTGSSNFKFYNKSEDFENRVEELTMDIVIQENNLKQVFPVNVHTFNNQDTDHHDDYIEAHQKEANMVHFDDINCVQDSTNNLYNYFKRPNIKVLLYKIYGKEVYNKLFCNG